MLERYLVRYFLAVVDQSSFSRAAQQCRVSQPTLSVGIAKLEDLVSANLFERSNRHVRLTLAGERLLPHARRIESEFNLALSAVHETPSERPLRFGVLNSVAGWELARMAALAVSRDPDVRFELVPGSARELHAKLAAGRIDAALTLTGGAAARLPQRNLRTEGFRLVIPESHRLAGRTEANAEDVAQDVMIVRRHCESLPETSRYFTERGVRPHFALRATNDERIMQMIAAGIGVTVMPESYGGQGIWSLRLTGFDITRTLGVAFAPTANESLNNPTGIVLAAIDSIGTCRHDSLSEDEERDR